MAIDNEMGVCSHIMHSGLEKNRLTLNILNLSSSILPRTNKAFEWHNWFFSETTTVQEEILVHGARETPMSKRTGSSLKDMPSVVINDCICYLLVEINV